MLRPIRAGLLGAALAVAFCASLGCFNSLSLRDAFSVVDFRHWDQVISLKSKGIDLFILKEVVENGFDFALRGFSISLRL